MNVNFSHLRVKGQLNRKMAQLKVNRVKTLLTLLKHQNYQELSNLHEAATNLSDKILIFTPQFSFLNIDH